MFEAPSSSQGFLPGEMDQGGETYMQRMRRLYGTQNANLANDVQGFAAGEYNPNAGHSPSPPPTSAPQPPNGNGTPYTPVTGNGKIPDPAPQAPAAPAPAPTAAAEPPKPVTRTGPYTIEDYNLGLLPETTNFTWGSGGQPGASMDAPAGSTVGWTPQQWVDYNNRYHPRTGPQTVTPGAGGASGGGVVPGAVSGDSALFKVPVPKLGELPPSYQGTQFTQYVAPEHGYQNALELGQITQLLQHPETLSPEIVSAMKQKAVEDALSQQRQLDSAAADDAAARGFSLSGGQAEAAKRKNAEAMQKAILGSNRDLDIQAVSQNRQDTLNALEQAERILAGQTARSSDIYNSTLKGQAATAADRQAMSQSAIQRALQQFSGNLDSANFDLGQQQANRDDYYRGKGLDLQKELGVGGLNLDQQRINNQNRQFDASNALNILQLLEQMRESDNGLGFNWASLNQNAQSNAINTLRSMGLL